MGFVNWVKTHVRASVAIVVFPVALIVCGAVMIASKVNYDNYVVEYNSNVLFTKANNPVSPTDVLVSDNFASKRASSYILYFLKERVMQLLKLMVLVIFLD